VNPDAGISRTMKTEDTRFNPKMGFHRVSSVFIVRQNLVNRGATP
jgi:hypothetical protein